MDHDLEIIAQRYQRFAADEAQGVSPIYERLALAVAHTPELLRFLATLPQDRQQPNLFFAAVRLVASVTRHGAELMQSVRSHANRLREVMLSRTTQTNEPARCAMLLPSLARLPPPLALLEVGASAGLCLLPDRYGYDYGHATIAPPSAASPVFPCHASEPTPIPDCVPEIVWRRGLDLNPLNVRSASDMRWLEILVWPEQEQRAARLKAAIALARLEPPEVVRGDLLTDLDRLIAAAPRNATVVVFHTAVLSYVPRRQDRDLFRDRLCAADAVWISNESPAVFSATAMLAGDAHGRFLMSVNGEPTAWTGPHGQSIEWLV